MVLCYTAGFFCGRAQRGSLEKMDERVTRILKYLAIGLLVAAAASAVRDALLIGLVAAMAFVVLDLYAPSVCVRVSGQGVGVPGGEDKRAV